MLDDASLADDIGGVRPRPGRRVSGHEPPAASILLALARHRGLTVVGDDAQSIYSFRAATVRNILDFPKQYSPPRDHDARHNYRSTQPILDATNGVIALAMERFTKNLWTQRTSASKPRLVTVRDEATRPASSSTASWRPRDGTPLRENAVLFRTPATVVRSKSN